MENCYQLGFPSNPNSLILIASEPGAGGLIGFCTRCNVFQCGVERGIISSPQCTGGAILRICPPANISQVYVTSNVSLQGSKCNIGGILGSIILGSGKVYISDSYSNAHVEAIPSSGGLFGLVSNIQIILKNGLLF